jgi:hypothetical protein
VIKKFKNAKIALDGAWSLYKRSSASAEYTRWNAKHSAWIPKFHNRYAGQDCFLMGNGPSLNQVDLSALGNFHLIGLNKIHLLLDRHPLDLTFHVAVNSLVIEQSWKEFTALDCPSFLSYRPAEKFVADTGNIHYFLTGRRITPCFSNVLDEPLWEGWTVTYVALQLAFFMWFRRIFLIGVDHNFACVGKPNEEQKMDGHDPNHFDPRYFAGQKWQLPDLEGSEMAYSMAKFAFERKGGAIFDATIGGKCEVFCKMNLSKAFSECRPKE